MTEFHKIPEMVSAAADNDSTSDADPLECDLHVDDPEGAPQDAEVELKRVFETLNELSAVGETCIAFDTDQLSVAELFELCRTVETIRDTTRDDLVQVSADDDLYMTVFRGVQLAEHLITLYANLLDIPTKTCPSSIRPDGDRKFTGVPGEITVGRVWAITHAASQSLDEIEMLEDSHSTLPAYIDIDSIEADCRVLANLRIEWEDSSEHVGVIAESHHFGVREAALEPNRHIRTVLHWLDAIDDRTDSWVYDQHTAGTDPLLIEQFEHYRTTLRALPQAISRIPAALSVR